MISCHCCCLRSAEPGALGTCEQAALRTACLRKLNCTMASGVGRAARGCSFCLGEPGNPRALPHRTSWDEAHPVSLGCSSGAVMSPSPPSSLCRDIRLIEVTENICKRLLDYNLHKERSGSNRFAKVRVVPSSQAPLTCPYAAGVPNWGSLFPSLGSPTSAQDLRLCCPSSQVWDAVLRWTGRPLPSSAWKELGAILPGLCPPVVFGSGFAKGHSLPLELCPGNNDALGTVIVAGLHAPASLGRAISLVLGEESSWSSTASPGSTAPPGHVRDVRDLAQPGAQGR